MNNHYIGQSWSTDKKGKRNKKKKHSTFQALPSKHDCGCSIKQICPGSEVNKYCSNNHKFPFSVVKNNGILTSLTIEEFELSPSF